MERPFYDYDKSYKHYPNDHHRFYHDNKFSDNKKDDDKKGLLTEFDFDEFNQNQNPIIDGSFRGGVSLIPLANTDLCIDDKCDHVLLNAAINWGPTGTFTVTVPLASPTGTFSFSGAIQARFTIWRGNPSTPNDKTVPLCSFIDSSPSNITGLAVVDADPATDGVQPGLAITAGFAPVTTDFKCVDENPKCGEVEYFLTMNILTFLPANIALTGATAVTLTAMEIKKNDDDCC
ncbi:hypothetical protein AF332_15150 [Sporosarcina globispora]|uniref:Uncharacterized protein n=1 Tax=Sporosarcina globispora TaxID=1459 RepID=A0A0M0GDV0_SPOGL|nr:hypothetical protein [Sporosarcina globispora]KON88024.1 hypothetical protein AF332_15150 [Sporosarcina globispora]